jgi:ABC-type uncharacterized transport system substrate-binding protein
MTHSTRVLPVLLCLTSLWAGQLWAHPHAWMDLQTRFLINDQHELTGLDLVWHFDDFYSANIIEDMKDKKEPLAQQYQEFAKQSVEFMAKENWLTHFTVDGKKIPFTPPTAYRTEKQDYHLKLHFVLPLQQPMPVAGKTFHLSIYDSTYYVEMLHHDIKAVSISDNAKNLCKASLKQPHPPADLSAFAASLDATQQSDDGLGKQFADEVILTCNP